MGLEEYTLIAPNWSNIYHIPLRQLYTSISFARVLPAKDCTICTDTDDNLHVGTNSKTDDGATMPVSYMCDATIVVVPHLKHNHTEKKE